MRVKKDGRALTAEERSRVLAVYPQWLARFAEFATETCLSEGDLLRLTDEMIDRKFRVVVPEGGRVKTGSEQASPLTDRALEILDEIKKPKRGVGAHLGADAQKVPGSAKGRRCEGVRTVTRWVTRTRTKESPSHK
jgi:integrase